MASLKAGNAVASPNRVANEQPTKKVHSALPAIDVSPPPARPHVAVKMKKLQQEKERAARVQNNNLSLLQRLGAIMRVNRLDNHWEKPLPKLNTKVGAFFDGPSLRSRISARSETSDATQSYYANVRCYACDNRKKSSDLRLLTGKSPSPHFYLPSLHSRSLTRSSQS